tara:strand:- start:1981 stop:2640 length:660 start_codon:yes stop_codon:yes gene_type:complete
MTNVNSINKPIFGLVGAGGFGRESIDFINSLEEEYEVYFVDNAIKSEFINDIKVISDDEFIKINNTKKFFNVSIADVYKREEISIRFIENGLKPLSIFSNTSINYGYNKIGHGCIFSDYTIIAANTKIGNFVHLNRGVQISHDSSVGNYVTFNPNVTCNGNTIIDDFVYFGSGVTMIHGTNEKPLKIGKGSIIGMGSVITQDVPPNVTMFGNPARIIKK